MLSPFFSLIGGMNSPAEYKIVNEIGEPLSCDEVWNETEIFELKINEIEIIPLDSLREMEEDLPERDAVKNEEIDGYKQEGLTKALEVRFEFKNIGYDGWQDGKRKRTGLAFNVHGVGYGKEGALVQPVPLKDAGFRYEYGDGIEKGMVSENNRLILLIPDDTRKVELTFQAMKSKSYRYENYFYYDIP